MDNKPKQLLLIDTSSVLYRNFHAVPELTSSKGFPTNALLGTMRTIDSLIRQHPGAHVVAVMDSGKPSFRKEIYPEYKANRSAMPDDLLAQVKAIDEIITARGVSLFRVEGVEADDLIASIVVQRGGDYERVFILTMDKDLAQLVDERVHIIYGKNNDEMDSEAVRAKFDVNPGQIVDYLSLLGDKSDNIPGAAGIGAKTAARILAGGRSLDEFMRVVDDGDKLKAKLAPQIDKVELARRLIALKDDVELPGEVLEPPPLDIARLRGLYSEYELKSLLAALDDIDPAAATLTLEQADARSAEPEEDKPVDLMGFDLEVVTGAAQLEAMLSALAKADLICLDTETTGLDYSQDELVGLALAVEDKRVWYIPLAHRDDSAQLAAGDVLAALAPALNDSSKTILAQNLKFDSNALYFASRGQVAIELPGAWEDTMLQAGLLRSQAGERIGLDALALKHFGRDNISFGGLIKKYAKQLKKPVGQVTFADVSVEDGAPYCAEDAVVCLRLHQEMRPGIESSPWRRRSYTGVDVPLARILARMERRGIAVNKRRLSQAGREFQAKIDAALIAIEDVAGRAVNPDSPRQLAEILFGQLELPVLARTAGKQPSTDASVLERLSNEFPSIELPRLVLDYRAARKLKSTYIDDLLGRASEEGSRIHTHFQQGVTLTGRLSSDSPNLQNIPVRSEDGLRIRSAFVAAKGHRLLSFDYSQVELRVIAHFSEDELLVRAFNEGQDVHNFTASEIFGIDPGEVDSHQRRVAKTINFGLVYGMTAHGMASRLGIAFAQARDYIDMYFQRYPGVRDYMERTRALAKEQGYVETLLGRQIPISHINDRNTGRRQHAERVAINAPVQGSGADIISRAMIDLDRGGLAFGDDFHLLLQVHDELLFEAREDRVEELSAGIAKTMSEAVDLRVPLVVNFAQGKDWGELSA